MNQKLREDLGAAVEKAQTADKGVDISTDVQGYNQAVDSLSASISACMGPDLLSESADVAVVARELEEKMKAKLRETIEKAEQRLREAISAAETTREWAPLAAYRETLVADEVLRESCGDAVTRAENLLATLRAEEKASHLFVSVFVTAWPISFFCRLHTMLTNWTDSCSHPSRQMHAYTRTLIHQLRVEWTCGTVLKHDITLVYMHIGA